MMIDSKLANRNSGHIQWESAIRRVLSTCIMVREIQSESYVQPRIRRNILHI